METEDLNQLLELTKENNKILRGMQRSARVGKFFKAVYWALILGTIFGSYYYLQPYIDQMLMMYNQAVSTLNDLKNKASNIPDPSSFNLPPQVIQKLDSMTKNK